MIFLSVILWSLILWSTESPGTIYDTCSDGYVDVMLESRSAHITAPFSLFWFTLTTFAIFFLSSCHLFVGSICLTTESLTFFLT